MDRKSANILYIFAILGLILLYFFSITITIKQRSHDKEKYVEDSGNYALLNFGAYDQIFPQNYYS